MERPSTPDLDPDADVVIVPLPKSGAGSATVIVHAYEGAVTAATRLFSFSKSAAPRFRWPIGYQQEMLASDDLLTFAIHTRRLIENTILAKQAGKFCVPVVDGGEGGSCPITRIINVLVHNRQITIERRAKRLRGPLRPFARVKSDKGQLIAFWIEELVDIFVVLLNEQIYEFCSDNGILLDMLESAWNPDA